MLLRTLFPHIFSFSSLHAYLLCKCQFIFIVFLLIACNNVYVRVELLGLLVNNFGLLFSKFIPWDILWKKIIY